MRIMSSKRWSFSGAYIEMGVTIRVDECMRIRNCNFLAAYVYLMK